MDLLSQSVLKGEKFESETVTLLDNPFSSRSLQHRLNRASTLSIISSQPHSVEVDRKGCDSNEEVFLDNGYKGEIVILLIPELSGTHSDALSTVHSNDDLHAILVSSILVKGLKAVLRLICELLCHLWKVRWAQVALC